MRHQHRLLPPRVLLYRGQAEQADQQHDQQYAARTAEDHAEEAVGAGEAGDPDQFADEVVDQRPEQQGRDEQQRAGCDDAGRGGLDVLAQVLRQRPAEHPGHRAGDYPGKQGQGFLDEAATQTDQAGNDDDGDHRPIDPGKCHYAAHKQKRRCILAERARDGKPRVAVNRVPAGSARRSR